MELIDDIRYNDTIINAIDEIAMKYRSALSEHRASGDSESFNWNIEIDGNRFVVYFELVDYWYYIENGRGPGRMPPIDAIEKWIRIKPIIPNAINNRVPDTRQLAYLIARKIGEEGTTGYHDLERTLNDSESQINTIKQEIISSVIKSLLGEENYS